MLAGQRVVVTRAAHQAARLSSAFEAAGATVVPLPLIEVAPAADLRALQQAAEAAPGFDWLVFTSTNAVEAFLPLVDELRRSRLRCVAVGPASAAALHRFAIEPAVAAVMPRAAGLLQALRPLIEPGARVLMPQADDARPDLARGLRAAGARVEVVVAYRKRLPVAAAAAGKRLFERSIGWVTCTSPRIVRHFTRLFAADWQRRRRELRAISIGPVTSAELRRLGVEPAAEAREPSDRALVDATIQSACLLG